MFHCEKCGSRFNAAYAVAVETCPRCHARDGTESPLTFSPFRRFELREPSGIAAGPMRTHAAMPAGGADSTQGKVLPTV